MDDEIYESMLYSCRHFKEITVDACNEQKEVIVCRIVSVLWNLQAQAARGIGKLVVKRLPLCSQEIMAPFLEIMMKVEELSMPWPEIQRTIAIDGWFNLQEDYQAEEA